MWPRYHTIWFKTYILKDNCALKLLKTATFFCVSSSSCCHYQLVVSVLLAHDAANILLCPIAFLGLADEPLDQACAHHVGNLICGSFIPSSSLATNARKLEQEMSLFVFLTEQSTHSFLLHVPVPSLLEEPLAMEGVMNRAGEHNSSLFKYVMLAITDCFKPPVVYISCQVVHRGVARMGRATLTCTSSGSSTV